MEPIVAHSANPYLTSNSHLDIRPDSRIKTVPAPSSSHKRARTWIDSPQKPVLSAEDISPIRRTTLRLIRKMRGTYAGYENWLCETPQRRPHPRALWAGGIPVPLRKTTSGHPPHHHLLRPGRIGTAPSKKMAKTLQTPLCRRRPLPGRRTFHGRTTHRTGMPCQSGNRTTSGRRSRQNTLQNRPHTQNTPSY